MTFTCIHHEFIHIHQHFQTQYVHSKSRTLRCLLPIHFFEMLVEVTLEINEDDGEVQDERQFPRRKWSIYKGVYYGILYGIGIAIKTTICKVKGLFKPLDVCGPRVLTNPWRHNACCLFGWSTGSARTIMRQSWKNQQVLKSLKRSCFFHICLFFLAHFVVPYLVIEIGRPESRDVSRSLREEITKSETHNTMVGMMGESMGVPMIWRLKFS